MGKEDQIIMAVKKDLLFKDKYFEGVHSEEFPNFEQIILNNFEWLTRGPAEQNYDYKQPITYCLIINPETKKVFLQQRAKKDEHYKEKRLQGKWSIGIGGHIDKPDLKKENPIYQALLREISEEIELVDGEIQNISAIGFINNDQGDVEKVHIGVLYLAKTNATEVIPKSKELLYGKLTSLDELNQIVEKPENEFEEWSKIAYGELKKILSQSASSNHLF